MYFRSNGYSNFIDVRVPRSAKKPDIQRIKLRPVEESQALVSMRQDLTFGSDEYQKI